MRTRRLLAAATLAALPLVAGALQTGPIRAAAEATRTRNAPEHPSGPQWNYIVGESGHLPSLFDCSLRRGWGAAGCTLMAL